MHRLIQSKTDGKLVEVPSPATAGGSGAGGGPPHRQSTGLEAPDDMPFSQVDEDLKEAMIASKLDAISQGGCTVCSGMTRWSYFGAQFSQFLHLFARRLQPPAGDAAGQPAAVL